MGFFAFCFVICPIFAGVTAFANIVLPKNKAERMPLQAANGGSRRRARPQCLAAEGDAIGGVLDGPKAQTPDVRDGETGDRMAVQIEGKGDVTLGTSEAFRAGAELQALDGRDVLGLAGDGAGDLRAFKHGGAMPGGCGTEDDEIGGGEVRGIEAARRPWAIGIDSGKAENMVGSDGIRDLARQRGRPDGCLGRAPGAAEEPRQSPQGYALDPAQLSAPMVCSSVSSSAPERTSSSAGRVWLGM
jgi:hypothetical protein